jgi:hypothetical protein
MRSYNELLKFHRLKLIKDKHEKEEKLLMEENSFPFNANIGMVFTSHKDHLLYMRYALQQYRKIKDMFIVGAYDTWYLNPNNKHHSLLPHPDIWYLAHMWVYKHYTWGGHSKRHGWLWLQAYAASVLKSFDNLEYIFTSNGDCIWDRPEGVYEIIDLLGDYDLMSGQSNHYGDDRPMIHSCSMIFKREVYFSFIEFMMKKLKESTIVSYTAEGLIGDWILENDIKYKHAPIQPIYKGGIYKGEHDTYCEEAGDSTWKSVLGFRNLISEKGWRCTNRKPPLDKKYFDLREPKIYWNDHDRKTLHKYYTTGDWRYILMGYDQDPELPTKDRVKPMKKKLEDYGENPIYKKGK